MGYTMELNDILHKDAVKVMAATTSKKRLLQEISDIAASVYGMDADTVLTSLLEREKLGSTGVGNGVAIPHARFEGIDKVLGLFIRLEKPTDFDSMDGQPADLIFTLLAPAAEGAEHLKALALVSRTMRSENIRNKLRANHDDSTIYSLLTEMMANKAA